MVNSVNDDILIISSEIYMYKVSLQEKNINSYYSMFKDLTLNFNDEKYNELREILKIIIYYNIKLDEMKFEDLKNVMNENI
jgi:hypothetical protein